MNCKCLWWKREWSASIITFHAREINNIMVLSGIDNLVVFSQIHNLAVLDLSNTEICLHQMLPCLVKMAADVLSQSDIHFTIPPSAKVVDVEIV